MEIVVNVHEWKKDEEWVKERVENGGKRRESEESLVIGLGEGRRHVKDEDDSTRARHVRTQSGSTEEEWVYQFEVRGSENDRERETELDNDSGWKWER